MSSTENPFLSIIIPFYKNFTYLDECLKHCLELDYPSYEILVVSNSPLQQSYEKVKVIIIEETGQGHKKNAGLAHAKGEICAFIDDDAYPDRNWLKNAVKYFADPDIVAVGGPGVTPPNDNLRQQAGGLIYSLPIGSGKMSLRYAKGKQKTTFDELAGYNLFIRTAFLKEIGGIDVKYRSGEDSLLSNLIIKSGKKFVYGEDVVVYHHRRPLFQSHLRQVSTYALHRGYLAKKYPETSAKLAYFLPTTLLAVLVIWLITGIFIPILLLPLVALILAYLILCFASAQIKSKNLKLSSLVCVGIPLTQLVYGLYFVKGLLTKELGSRPSY
jgi:cellulose synthase/poly-beta-1,6-N-acetylglucosamine synthase-like glycosyltransferase